MISDYNGKESGGTLWSAVKPVVEGRGGVVDIEEIESIR
jgi:hypothetical protein